MRARPLFALLAVLAAAGCDPDVVWTDAGIDLVFPDEGPCRPDGRFVSATLRALGDFQTDNSTVEVLEPGTLPATIETFPFETRVLSVDAAFDPMRRYGGTAFLADGPASVRIRMLPFGPEAIACPGPPEARLYGGAVAAALPDGALLVAGGRDPEMLRTRLEVVVVPAGERAGLASLLPTARWGASATVVGNRVVIAGGGLGFAGEAHPTFDVVDATAYPIPTGATGNMAPRRDHGAVALADGRVLLLGGVTTFEEGARALSTAEIIDPARPELGALFAGRFPRAMPGSCQEFLGRTRPGVARLDDGTVLVVGGVGACGVPPAATTQVYAWLPPEGPVADDEETFEEVADLGLTRQRRDAEVFALTGDRAIRVGGVGGSTMTPMVAQNTLDVLLRIPPDAASPPDVVLCILHHTWMDPDPALEFPELCVASVRTVERLRDGCEVPAGLQGIPALADVQAVPLADGRIFMMGRDLAAGEACAYTIDAGTGHAVERPADAVPLELVALADGSIAELHEDRTVLRREILLTPFDDPESAYFVEPTPTRGLAFDFADRWDRRDGAFVALANDSRVDVASLRFGDVEVELVGTGALDILLTSDGRPSVAVHYLGDAVEQGRCVVPIVAGAPFVMTRRGGCLGFDGEECSCRVEGLDEHVGIAVRARAIGAAVRSLRIARLDE